MGAQAAGAGLSSGSGWVCYSVSYLHLYAVAEAFGGHVVKVLAADVYADIPAAQAHGDVAINGQVLAVCIICGSHKAVSPIATVKEVGLHCGLFDALF